MSYEPTGSGTTYLIFYNRLSENIRTIKQNSSRMWEIPARNQSVGLGYPDVFMLHCMIFYDQILRQKVLISGCQERLYAVLNEVNKHVRETSRREELKEFTIKLNGITQDLDLQAYSLDLTLNNMKMLSKSHHLLEKASCSSSRSGTPFPLAESIERLRILLEENELYLSYLKTRKETGMNLVSTASPKELDVYHVIELKTGFQSRKST